MALSGHSAYGLGPSPLTVQANRVTRPAVWDRMRGSEP
jgi:hypothetical protein